MFFSDIVQFTNLANKCKFGFPNYDCAGIRNLFSFIRSCLSQIGTPLQVVNILNGLYTGLGLASFLIKQHIRCLDTVIETFDVYKVGRCFFITYC